MATCWNEQLDWRDRFSQVSSDDSFAIARHREQLPFCYMAPEASPGLAVVSWTTTGAT